MGLWSWIVKNLSKGAQSLEDERNSGPHFKKDEMDEADLGGKSTDKFSLEVPLDLLLDQSRQPSQGSDIHQKNTEELERDRQAKIDRKVRIALGEKIDED